METTCSFCGRKSKITTIISSFFICERCHLEYEKTKAGMTTMEKYKDKRFNPSER